MYRLAPNHGCVLTNTEARVSLVAFLYQRQRVNGALWRGRKGKLGALTTFTMVIMHILPFGAMVAFLALARSLPFPTDQLCHKACFLCQAPSTFTPKRCEDLACEI